MRRRSIVVRLLLPLAALGLLVAADLKSHQKRVVVDPVPVCERCPKIVHSWANADGGYHHECFDGEKIFGCIYSRRWSP